jgi:hypothetical protein
VAFSPDGKKIVSGSWDNSVRIWNAETGKAEGNSLQCHTSDVRSVALSPDGKKIVSGSDDSSVRIWNAMTPMSEDGLNAPAFPPPGKSIPVKFDTSTLDTPSITANIQYAYSLSLCPLHNFHHHLHFSPSLQMISLQPDGWLCGSDLSSILWIPPEYRDGFLAPPLQLLISSSIPMIFLNLQNFVHGINWPQCYIGKEFHPVFHCSFTDLKKGLQTEINFQSVEPMEMMEHEINSQLEGSTKYHDQMPMLKRRMQLVLTSIFKKG